MFVCVCAKAASIVFLHKVCSDMWVTGRLLSKLCKKEKKCEKSIKFWIKYDLSFAFTFKKS